jgi:N-acetylated-alpha-linked acidic dipeptidase
MKNIALFIFAFLISLIAVAEEVEVLDGFSSESSSKQLQFEKMLKDSISPQQIEKHLKWLTSRPHRAGTEGTRITAEYLLEQLKQFGFQSEIVQYDAYLPAPISVEIQLTRPVQETIPTTEEKIEGDPFTDFVNEHPGWNGYSPSGEATGQIVYAHHGSKDDFQMLKELGIDLKGKILLMRYFGTGEGTKVQNAEQAGAAAVVLYSDPAEDGFRYGEVYPKGDWRPPGGIMRRSILNLTGGDPLSPGWASKQGAKRLKPEEVHLPKVPVLPISYKSAQRILSLLGGPSAPYEWQGALCLTYKIGPGPAEVHLRTQMDNRDRKMLNVIARMPGSTDPDQWIIVGNHHDAWIFGAGDPSSGTAALLTLAESLGKLAKQGFQPKRTLILTFWDAEEMILGGSTEWVEDHEKELLEKAVACINMDSAVFNTDRPLSVSSHPVLHNLFRAASRNIRDPRSGRSLFEVWTDLQNQYRKVPGVDGWGDFFDPEKTLTEPYVFESPSDDAEPFLRLLALPASDMYYGAEYGMYHSIYENFHWMKTVVDPTFEYHKVMAQLQGFVATRLANADLLSLDYATEATYWRRAYLKLDRGNKIKFQQELNLIDEWEQEAKNLLNDERKLLNHLNIERSSQFPELNRKIYQIARDFHRAEGFPEDATERNLFSKLSNGQNEPNIYLTALKKRVQSLQAVRKQLEQLQ